MSKKVFEGELLNSSDKQNINKKVRLDSDIIQTKFPFWRVLLCLLPVVGLVFAIAWFYLYKQKQKIEIVFPIIGIVAGLFSTVTFVVLRFILKAIF